MTRQPPLSTGHASGSQWEITPIKSSLWIWWSHQTAGYEQPRYSKISLEFKTGPATERIVPSSEPSPCLKNSLKIFSIEFQMSRTTNPKSVRREIFNTKQQQPFVDQALQAIRETSPRPAKRPYQELVGEGPSAGTYLWTMWNVGPAQLCVSTSTYPL